MSIPNWATQGWDDRNNRAQKKIRKENRKAWRGIVQRDRGTKKPDPNRARACTNRFENESREDKASACWADQMRLRGRSKKSTSRGGPDKDADEMWVTIAGLHVKKDAHGKQNTAEKAGNWAFSKQFWGETRSDKEVDERNEGKDERSGSVEDASKYEVAEKVQESVTAYEFKFKAE